MRSGRTYLRPNPPRKISMLEVLGIRPGTSDILTTMTKEDKNIITDFIKKSKS